MDSLPPNPYGVEAQTASDEQSLESWSAAEVPFVPILLRWERLRLWYNGILIAWTVLLSVWLIPNHLLLPEYWILAMIGGMITNLCFFTGPALEAYGRYFGLWHSLLSYILFIVGLSFTGMIATGFVLSHYYR